jgi:hypothetical protein
MGLLKKFVGLLIPLLAFNSKQNHIFFLSFSGVVQKVIFHFESQKYMYIMYKKCKIKHISDNVGEN